MSEKKKLHVIGTRVGGNLSRAVYLAPHQVFDVDFFSSLSLEQPSYKIILDLNHKISPINLFSVSEKKKLIGTVVGGNLSRAV